MFFEGDSEVMNSIKQKKNLMDAGLPHEHLRPLLIIDGGLMKGVYGAGAALALAELNMTSCFSALAGVSSGAVTAAYMLSGNVKIGSSIFYEEACSRKFRPRFDLKNILNTIFFQEVLAGKTNKGLEVDTILSHTIPMYIGVSEFATGKPVLITPTTDEELLVGIRASISMPGAVSLPAIVNGIRYVDGASTDPHVLEHMLATIEATHVLVITNQDKGTKHISWFEHFVNNSFFRSRMTPLLRTAANWRREARHAFIEKTLEKKIKPVLFVWGNGSVKSYERNPEIVRGAMEKSRQWWLTELVG